MVPAFVLGIALSVLASAGATQTVTVASLLESLATEQAGPKVRSLSSAAKRGIAIEGPLPPDLDLPKVNLTINFEFDSTRLTTDAMDPVSKMPELKACAVAIEPLAAGVVPHNPIDAREVVAHASL